MSARAAASGPPEALIAKAVRFDPCLIGSWKLTKSTDFANRPNGALLGLKMKVSRTSGSVHGYRLGVLRLDFSHTRPVGAETGIPTTIRGIDVIVVWSEPNHPDQLQVKSEKPLLTYTNEYGSRHSKNPVWDAAHYTCSPHKLKLTFVGVNGGSLLSRATFNR